MYLLTSEEYSNNNDTELDHDGQCSLQASADSSKQWEKLHSPSLVKRDKLKIALTCYKGEIPLNTRIDDDDEALIRRLNLSM